MTVSIGMSFLNPGRAFEKAVRSVFAQTWDDWELILIDDGSSDGSGELARAMTDPRVRLVSDGVNRGVCARLNQITDLARGELLCRMDADDVMHPDRVRRQVGWMRTDPSVDVLGARAVAIDEHDRPVCLLGLPFSDEDVERAALVRALFVQPAVMARTEWFRAHRYDPQYVRSEDHEIWLRGADHSKYAFCPEPLLFYRQPNRLNVKAYVATCRTDRKIFSRYGPRIVGAPTAGLLWTKSLALEAIHRAAAALRVEAPLMRLRGERVPREWLPAVEGALRRAVSADVAGWPKASER